jgi:phosphoserine aminotransferase
MKKVHNFNAGPCVLPREAVNTAIEALKDFAGTGMSVIEVSHRSKEWEAQMAECEALWRELLEIPENYKVLFLGGGASMQFCMVPFNLMEKKAAYLETGVWAKKAFKEAKGFGEAIKVTGQSISYLISVP